MDRLAHFCSCVFYSLFFFFFLTFLLQDTFRRGGNKAGPCDNLPLTTCRSWTSPGLVVG